MLVILKPSQRPVDVDGFPEGAQRSRPGSISLMPAVACSVTADELAHINKLGIPVDVLEDAPAPPARKPTVSKTAKDIEADIKAAKGGTTT